MNTIIGFILVAGMAVTFIVAANQSQGVLQFICYVWAVFLGLALLAQIVRRK